MSGEINQSILMWCSLDNRLAFAQLFGRWSVLQVPLQLSFDAGAKLAGRQKHGDNAGKLSS